MIFLKKIFAAPIFDDEIKTQQAYMLHIILWTLICVPLPFVIYAFLLRPESLNRTLLQALSGETVNIILLVMLRRGYVKAASMIQVGAFWLFFTATAFTGNGVQSEAYLLGYGLVIVIAGILLGGRGASVFTILSIASGCWMALWHRQEIFNFGFDNSPLTTWVVSLVLFPVGAVLQYLASRTTRVALSRAQASEEKYRMLSQISSDYTFATEVHKDGSSSLSWVAGAFEIMTGYTFEEYVSTGGWVAHIHPDDIEKDAQDMKSLHENQSVTNSDIRTFTKSGEIRWERIFAHPVWNEKENRLIRIVGAVQDVTEQKRIEAKLAYERDILQIFMDNIPDLVYFKDAESRFVRINKAQAQFLGVNDPQEALGKTDLDFQDTKIAQELLLDEKRIIETGRPIWNHIEFNPTKDGTPRWLSTTKVPAKNEFGQTIGTIGISRNITRQKIAEEVEQNRRAMLEKVIKLGQYVTEATDLRATLTKIWNGIHHDLGFDRLAIFFYDPIRKSMDGTFGTNNLGEMTDDWHVSHQMGIDENPASLPFFHVLEKPDTIYITRNFEKDYNIPKTGHVMSGVKDFASIAAWAGDKPVAFISVDHNITHRPITDEQLESLRLFTGYAGLAIENARLNEKIQNELAQQIQSKEREKQRRAILEKAVKLGQHVTEVRDLRTTLTKIWQGVHDDLGFDRVGLFLYNPVLKSMDGSFGTNNQGEMTDEWSLRISLDEDIQEVNPFLQTLKQPDTVFFTHSYEDDYLIPKGHNMSGVKDHALIAAWAGEEPMATISVDHRITGRPITEEQLEGLRLFAGYAGLAIENARLNTALQNELTQRKETLLHQSAILNGIPDMAWLKDKDGRYVAVNEPFASTAGIEMEEIVGKTDFDIWKESFAERYRNDDLEVMRSGQRKHHIEELQVDSSGREYWVETTKTPILNDQGEVIGSTGIAHEITARKKAEQERETLIAELEAKNAELERFTYTVSHDLKSPLVTIRGFLGYLERDALDGNIEKLKHDKQRIESAVGKMQNLLNDLLELSRVGRLMNPHVEIPFREIVKDALEIMHGQIKSRNVLIDRQDNNIIIKCDQTRITEALQNLIDNAIKFMGDQTNPRIEIGAFINDNNSNVFYVKDNGIGIAPEFHEKIFGLFEKLTAGSDSTGIGLALVKRIIELHGGRIWLESDIGKGATFYFTLDQT